MSYKVQIQFDEPIPECCSDCRFCYDYLYCVLDNDKQITVHEDEGRPNHCKLMQADVREVMEAIGYKHLICPHCLSEYYAKTKAEMFCPDCGEKLFFSKKCFVFHMSGRTSSEGTACRNNRGDE